MEDKKVKLEYVKNGEPTIKLWERKSDFTLETTFNSEGFVLLQKLTNLDEKGIDHRIKETLYETHISKIAKKEYSEVKINKSCPNCGQNNLQRYVDAFASRGDVPVMPIYHCNDCSAKSFYATDAYLEHLIDNNRALFSEAELGELEKDRNAFKAELKAYIIRIFASKKILNIK